MKFVCEIGNCKRLKKPVEFATFEELHRHANSSKWVHGTKAHTRHEAHTLHVLQTMRQHTASGLALMAMKNELERKR